MDKVENFTSTGSKFWLHMDKMNFYRRETGRSIISTHVSPEGKCNLNCSYCSVKKRKKHFNIELEVIKDYVTKLCSRGLKAVIITGGGEPTLYPHFNELVQWLKYDKKLSIGLITNGTLADRVEVWDAFSWVRVSLNMFDNWENRIFIPRDKLNKNCVLGCSLIYVGQPTSVFISASNLAKTIGAEYIRVLPDCLWDQGRLLEQHDEIRNILNDLNEPLFFHQFKIHGTPASEICHQAYFRPYLSEVEGGTVYPCDSLVLNDAIEKFDNAYQICKAEDILEFLGGDIKMKFDPRVMCKGCVFTDNVNMLDRWKKTGHKEIEPPDNLIHKEFI